MKLKREEERKGRKIRNEIKLKREEEKKKMERETDRKGRNGFLRMREDRPPTVCGSDGRDGG